MGKRIANPAKVEELSTKLGDVPSGKTAQGEIDELNSNIANKSKIQTISKTVTVTKGNGTIAQNEIPGSVISAYMTDGWKVAVTRSGDNYAVTVFSADNGAFIVYPNNNWGVSITFVYFN